MSELFDLATTAAANTDRFPEGMQFRNVNDGARELEAMIARTYKDTSGGISAGGSVNAFTITANRAIATLAQGTRFAFKSNATITGACTLNISGSGAKEIVDQNGASLIAGDIVDGQIVEVVYRSDLFKWQMVSQSAREIPDTDAIQAAAADYISDNADTVRNDLWVMRPIVSATTTAAPSGATDGALYIVPSGASGSTWASNIGKIAEAAGGSWNYHTPVEGWSVFAKDSDTVYVYDTDWNAISAAATDSSTLEAATFKWVLSNQTDGGTPVDETWTAFVLNTTVQNSITGCSINTGTGIVTLPAGTYLAIGAGSFYENGYTRVRISATTAGVLLDGVSIYDPPSTSAGSNPPVFGVFTLASSDSVSLQYYVEQARNTYGIGRASTKAGSGSECYAALTLVNMASFVGATGADGDPGADGAGYLASSSASVTIGTGSKTFSTSSGLAYAAGDIVRIKDTAAPTTNYMIGSVTSYSSTSLVVDVTSVGGSGTKTSWSISLTGDTGDAGDDGVGYGGTSTTSLAIGTGSKTWATQAGLGYVVGGRVRWANSSTNYMEGTITDYTGTSMTVTVDETGGSGTLATWSAQAAGIPGLDGAGSGTVTDITASGGIETDDGAIITDSGGIRGVHLVNAQTGTSYTFVSGDRGKVVSFENASAIAVTLPQAQSSTAAAVGYTGWYVLAINDGAGVVTITPTTSTIGGASSLALSQHQGALIVSDGTNYKRFYLSSSGSVDLYALIDALTAETAPSASDTIPINDVSAVAAREMTLADLFKTINLLGSESSPAADDTLALFDISTSEADTITLGDLFKVIASLTSLTAVDAADSLPVYDASASSTKVATVSNVFAALNTLTEDTAPSMTADYVGTYDSSAAASKKVLLGKVGVGKYSFYVDAASMKSTTTGSKTGATLTANRDLGANDVGGSVLSFSATAKTHAWFRYAMPKGWDQGTVTARFYWTAATGTGTVEWEIAAAILRDDDSTGTSLGAAVTVTDALLATDDAHITAETGAITAGGTAANPCLVLFQIARDGTVGNTDDTFSAAAQLLGVEISYTRSANTDD